MIRASIIFLPCILAYSYLDDPQVGYLLSWGGSVFILLAVFLGIAQKLPKDLGFFQQFFRPYLYMHLLFATYTSLTSFFYFLHLQGYVFFEKVNVSEGQEELQALAFAQFCCLLNHAAYAYGQVINIAKYETQEKEVEIKDIYILRVLKYAIGFYVLSILMRLTGLFSAVALICSYFSFFLSLLALLKSVEMKKYILLNVIILVINLGLALTTGMKESILSIIILLSINFFSRYKVATIIGFVLVANLLIYLPLYTNQVRALTWYGQSGTVIEALQETYKIAISEDERSKQMVQNSQWSFLYARLSEIAMLRKYIDYIPAKRDFYGLELVETGLLGIIPRFLRTDGKSIDQTAMERALSAGVLESFIAEGGTSAKPSLVADGYMMGGFFTILLCGFIYGWLSTVFSLACERWFGGYTIGTTVVFMSTFNLFGLAMPIENVFAALFYGILCLIVLRVATKNVALESIFSKKQ